MATRTREIHEVNHERQQERIRRNRMRWGRNRFEVLLKEAEREKSIIGNVIDLSFVQREFRLIEKELNVHFKSAARTFTDDDNALLHEIIALRARVVDFSAGGLFRQGVHKDELREEFELLMRIISTFEQKLMTDTKEVLRDREPEQHTARVITITSQEQQRDEYSYGFGSKVTDKTPPPNENPEEQKAVA